MIASWQETDDETRQFVEKQRNYSADGLPSGHVRLWEPDCKEGRMPKNWCLWTVVLEKTLESPPWTARRLNQSILREIYPEYLLEGLMLKLQYFSHLMQWTWNWANSGRWWGTGRPVMLQFMGLQSQTWLANWTTTTNILLGYTFFEAFIPVDLMSHSHTLPTQTVIHGPEQGNLLGQCVLEMLNLRFHSRLTGLESAF